jgi:hypothetical protein
MPAVEFQDRRLFLTDFDNTYALTNQPAPNGINVQTAYELAIERIFGLEGLDQYIAVGGLNNRTPGEIVDQLAPDLDQDARQTKTDDLVEEKLSHLLDQVGRRLTEDGAFWPRLSRNFRQLWMQMVDSPSLSTGVVTSGHRAFVDKFHDIHALAKPEFMLTDDEMRPMSSTRPIEQCVKPSRLLLEIIHKQWLAKYDEPESSRVASKPQLVYAGDDIVKDGKLAENYGVLFRRIDALRTPEHSWHLVADALHLIPKGQSLGA